MKKQTYDLEERLLKKPTIPLFPRQYRRDERSALSSIFVTSIKTDEKKEMVIQSSTLIFSFDVGCSFSKATPVYKQLGAHGVSMRGIRL